jgi:hypothetical protein
VKAAKGRTVMATDTHKHTSEREPGHSAFAEFQRDERRPAVMLLIILIIAALFFALGIMVGRWTAQQPTTRAVAPVVRQ